MQHNDQKNMDNRIDNDLQDTKDRVTRTPFKTKLALIDNADSGVKRKL